MIEGEEEYCTDPDYKKRSSSAVAMLSSTSTVQKC